MKNEEIKDSIESASSNEGADRASEPDFEFIPSPTGFGEVPLFSTENEAIEEDEPMQSADAATDDESMQSADETATQETLATDSEPMLQIEPIDTNVPEDIPIQEDNFGDATEGNEPTTEGVEETATALGEPSEPEQSVPKEDASVALDDASMQKEEEAIAPVEVDEPTLLPEDILAATEQKEEQISFFDDKAPRSENGVENKKERSIDTRFDFLEICIFTLVAVLIITTFFFRHSIVDGSSMEPTLSDQQHLILTSFFYTPEVGDIIVCEDYSTALRKPIVKRVIATEGQTVVIVGPREIYVDGERLEEDYANSCNIHGDGTHYPIVHTVGEGHVFVMGDHRDASTDSRAIGDVSVDSIIGKVVLRFSPFTIFD